MTPSAGSETPHTPTPWKAGMGSIGGPCISGGTTERNVIVAYLPSKYFRYGEPGAPLEDCGSDEIAANARLIVTAVNCHADLLAACEAAMPWLRENHFACETAATVRAAIAKAKGTT